MMNRQTKIYFLISTYMFLLCLHSNIHSAIAYIPQALRSCIINAYEMIDQNNNTRNLAELYSIVQENRIVVSDKLIRKGLEEALSFFTDNKKILRNNNQNRAIQEYIKRYLNNLDDSCVVLALNGAENQHISLPISSVVQSLPQAFNEIDLMCLSSMLTTKGLSLHGYPVNDTSDSLTRAPKPNKSTDPGIVFNSNMMTNVLYSTPNVIFGTGVSSPVINAWSMVPSAMIQSPINIQLPIPGDLKEKKSISLELHFLVTKQFASGKARIRVKAAYMDQSEEFNILAPVFSNITDSDSFTISEPSSVNNLKHLIVTISLKSSDVDKADLALLSLTRIAPSSGSEYAKDIYLAAAIFRYTD